MRLGKRIHTLLLIVTALALAFVYLPVEAQLTTGRMDVGVKAEDGAKLPGATVTVSNDFFNKTAVTDSTGMARFLALPPGTYKATATLDGFNGIVQENIDIKSGETETICLTLTLAEVTEELIVTTEAPIIDVTETISKAILDEEILLKFLPTSRSFQDTTFLITEPLPEIKHCMAIVAPFGDFPAKIMWAGEGPLPDGFIASASCYFYGLELSGFRNAISVTSSGAGTSIANCDLINNSDDGAYFNLSGLPQSDTYIAGIFNSKLSWNGGNGATIMGANGMTMIQNNEFCNNRGEGTRIENSSNGSFGGTEPGQGNIVGNNGDGMSMINSSEWAIQGNYFGTNPRLEDMGNQGAAIGLAGNSSNNKIGGDSFGANNLVAYNGHGIIAFSGTSRNLFLFNQIFKNIGLGINLNFPDGVTQNDPLDFDGGANGSQNFPELTSATASDTDTIIQGGLFSLPNSQFLIQYYASGEGHASGNGEGQNPLGARTVTTNGSGFADVSARVPVPLPGGQIITTLATNLATNDTSEFSQGVEVEGTAQPDLELTKSGPENAACETDITYTITVRNTGTAAAVGTRVVDDLPTCIGDEVEVTTSQGLSLPNDKNFGVVTLSGRIDPGQEVTITIKARLTKDCKGLLTNRATAIAEGDRNPQNDFDLVSTRVDCPMITGMRVKGKKVIVQGEGFENGDQVEINGMDPKKTKFKNSNTLVAKKGAQLLKPCNPSNPGETNILNLRRRRPSGNDAIVDTQAFATCP